MGKTRRKTPDDLLAPPKPDSGLPFEITYHAIKRFQSRIAGMPFHAAARELEILACTAKRTGGRTRHGDELWEATNGDRIRFVVKRDGSRRICPTVLLPSLREDPADV
jgi:hypothetical protein